MADFRLLDEYPPGTANGCCYLCRASIREIDGRKEKVVDTLVHIYGEGYLVLCESCLSEAARLLNMLTPESSTKLEERNKELQAEVLQMKTDLAIAGDTIVSLTRWNEVQAPAPEASNAK
jgi:hypothetical protein